jgi:parallel beta-helix repeat protein
MKRIRKARWAAILLVAGIILLGAVSAWAAPDEVWVDDDFTAATPGWGTTKFNTIQAGVDAVAAAGTVRVANGTYGADPLTGKCAYITKDGLSLIGESETGTIIDGAVGSVGSSGSYWPKGIHVQANNVTVRDLTVQGFTGDLASTGGYGVLFRDYAHDTPSETYIYYTGCVAENIRSQNNYSPMYALVNRNLMVRNCLIQNNLSDGMFIARESDNATITGNTVINSGDQGIWVGKCWMGLGPSDNATITDNTVNGAREGGISFVASDGAIISGNTITNVAGEGPPAWNGWSVGAISLKDGASDVKVYNNTIYNNAGSWNGYSGTGNGIGIDGTPLNILIYYNNIYGNSGYAVYNYSTVPVTGDYNWWGDLDPSDNINGLVTFLHWLSVFWTHEVWVDTTYDATTPGWGGDHFNAIQSAINPVPAGTTVHVAAGTYNETVTISKDTVTISGDSSSRPAVTGGLSINAGISSPTLENLVISGNGGSSSVVRMSGATTDLTFTNCVFDGENASGRCGFSGGQLEGNVSITNCEFKNILGWALFESRSGSGGDGSAMGTITFANNHIHDSNGSVVFRGLSTDRTDIVNVYGNTWENIGGANGERGQHWAGLEVNRSQVVNIYSNDVSNVLEGQWGEGQGFQLWNIDTLSLHHNNVANNFEGIFVYGGGGSFTIPGGSLRYNNISGNTEYGVKVDSTATGGPLDAALNWWGSLNGPVADNDGNGTPEYVGGGDKVIGNIIFSPWLGIDPDGDPGTVGVQRRLLAQTAPTSHTRTRSRSDMGRTMVASRSLRRSTSSAKPVPRPTRRSMET